MDVAACSNKPLLRAAISHLPRTAYVEGLGKNGRNAYSAGNHQIIEEESIGGIAIPQGITSSSKRNSQE
jgi:hypothetical protein